MSARKAAGAAYGRLRASAAHGWRAAALSAPWRTSPSMTTPASDEVKPRAAQVHDVRGSRASTGPSATAGGGGCSVLGANHPAACAPCGSFSPASQTLPANHGRQPSKRVSDLFQSPGGLTMAKPAPSFFYDHPKSVPLGGFCKTTHGKPKSDGKPLIHKRYTLCEVEEAKRQSVPLV